MTFTEAALEVLRTAGEPLHYKKITELAIERNLLSHVGKTPEVTMSSRLAMMVKKDRGQAPIIKVKPGVFAIRESALQGTSLSPEALAAISEVEGGLGVGGAVDGLGESKALEGGAVVSASTTTEESLSIAPKAPNVPLPGSDVFPEEEGDDDPILAGLEQDSEGGERSGRRRRRRRRRKGDKPEVATEAPSQRSENSSNNNQRERFRDRSRQDRSERPERSERSERADRNDRFERQERRASSEDRSESRGDAAEANLDWNRQPADGDLLGKDLADAVSSVMARGDRTPHTFARVAELLVRRGRLSGAPAALAPTIAAAVRADIARAELQRARPRFRLRAGRLSLSDWHLPKGLQRAEQDLLAGAERYASEMRRALIQKLSELPTAGFAELLATWLNAEGVTALRAVRRPGSSGSELHFAGTRKTGSEEVRLAIVVQRGSRDIDREGVIDVRGALHHYGQAQAAWIVTLGRITSGAREEAGAQAAACALFDGNALVAAMERLGVAVRRNVIMHHEIDYDLLESLGDSPEQRERREREQERERREHNERNRAAQQQRSRSGRAPSLAPARDEREELDEDEQSANEGRKVKLRDADWDDEAPHDLAVAAEDDGVSEAPAPRAFALHDADSDEDSATLRDELESDSDDEQADDEDFSTREENDETDSDEDFAARDSDVDDSDADDEGDNDSDDEDDVEARHADSDDDSDEDDAADSDDSDDDFRAGADDESDESDSDNDEGDDQDADDRDSDDDSESDEEEISETAERGRRR